RLWEARSGREVHTLVGHSDWVSSVAFSPDGAVVASGSRDNTVRLWEVRTGREVRTLAGHSDAVLSVAFSPDETLLASGSEDNTVRLWDRHSGQLQRTSWTLACGGWATYQALGLLLRADDGQVTFRDSYKEEFQPLPAPHATGTPRL